MVAFRLHFEEQEYYYGKQFLVSLVSRICERKYQCVMRKSFCVLFFSHDQTNHHGAEGRLNGKYRELAETCQNDFIK